MPLQQVFLDETFGDARIQVIKTYDTALAREAFISMDATATAHLAESLSLQSPDESWDLPNEPSQFADVLWTELMDIAREDGQLRSFFVVRRLGSGEDAFIYVSGDWPSAEALARGFRDKPR